MTKERPWKFAYLILLLLLFLLCCFEFFFLGDPKPLGAGTFCYLLHVVLTGWEDCLVL